jgi:glycerol-3-phosphate dehydrogenase
MRQRQPEEMGSVTYDLLVIGGGIYGLACAYDAASRGLRVALVEADDFGAGISFNHQKTAHGGLRMLQSGRIDRAREAVLERRALARIAPWLLRPLPFIVGTYRSIARSRMALRAAFKLDAWIGRNRNVGIEPELHLPRAKLISRTATVRFFPGIRETNLTGGAQWYDYQMVESDRLTFAFAEAADRAGADLANHAEAQEPLREGSRIVGMRVRDRLDGSIFDVRAAVVLNAAGAGAADVMAAFGVKREAPLLRAMNLLTTRPAGDIALAAPDSSGRMLTLVPWRGRALVGTSQSSAVVKAGDNSIPAAEIDDFVTRANAAFPALELSRSDIALVHHGLVPAAAGRGGAPDLLSAPELIDHARDGVEGAFTVRGVKYTTARKVAERVTNRIAKKLGRAVRPPATATRTLPGAGIADHEALAIEATREVDYDPGLAVIRHLIGRYAENGAAIVRLMARRPELRMPVSTTVPTLGAEVVHAIRTEMALTLADVVIRRTALGAAGHPGSEAVAAAAALAASELGWSEPRVRDEVAAVEAFYKRGTG